jgi:hypothetical protein
MSMASGSYTSRKRDGKRNEKAGGAVGLARLVLQDYRLSSIEIVSGLQKIQRRFSP